MDGSHTSLRAFICSGRAVERELREQEHTYFLFIFCHQVLLWHCKYISKLNQCAHKRKHFIQPLLGACIKVRFLPSGLSGPPVLWQMRVDPLQ